MKKLFFIFTFSLLFLTILAQTPESFKYQAVLRDDLGVILSNQPVGIQISILQGSQTGTTVYTEEFAPTTNQYGLINLNIGEGTTTDLFNTINWVNGPYFIKIDVDITGGTNYQELGTSELKSVPFALLAKDIQNKQILNFSNDTLYLTDGGQVYMGAYGSLWESHGNDIYNSNTGYVGVGIEDPMGKLVVQGDSVSNDTLPLFEVKNKDGVTIFAVYDGGVRIYVNDDPAKANNNKSGFAVGGYRMDKSLTNEYLRVSPDSIRMYIKENSINKYNNNKGGFAVGGYRMDKTTPDNYFNIFGTDTLQIIDPSEPRILWYPLKEAFLVGRVLIESPDSVGQNSFATGFESKAIGNYSQAMGYKVISKGINSTAIGNESYSTGVNSYAFGNHVLALDSNSYAFGSYSVSLAKGSFAFGTLDTASGKASMALGYNTKASGLASLTLGAYTLASDTLSVAMGYRTIADGVSSIAMGTETHASGGSSMALGYNTLASGGLSLSLGNSTTAAGESSTAMGYKSQALGLHSTAMGDSTIASGHDATTLGYQTIANGYFSTAMGYKTIAHGLSSYAAGSECTANGEASIAMGSNTNTEGLASTAIGINTSAQGDASIAFGLNTTATASGSFIIGSFNTVLSSVNSTDPNSELFVVANGNSVNTHNAITVFKTGFVGINTDTPDKLLTVNGDARVTGDIYYGPINSITIYDKPDFVFNPNYDKNIDILKVEKFIAKNNHLPWLTSAKDEKGGVNMTRMGFETLEAVENQQLQIIKLKKEIDILKKQIEELKQFLEIKATK